MDKKQALEEYLAGEGEAARVEETSWGFETEDGLEYIVLDDDERAERMEQDLRDGTA